MFYVLAFLISINLLAEAPGFKPLPNWLFVAVIVFLILAKILIGKFVKNRMKQEDLKKSQENTTKEQDKE